jgi:hypothetical protein
MTSGVCAVGSQTSVFTQELLMYSSFTPANYQSASSLSVIKCTGLFDYYMLGSVGGNSYIQKVFTGLGTNHWLVSVMYGYALMGSTAWTQPLVLKLIDGNGAVTTDTQTPSCTPDGLSGCAWSAGCYATFEVPAFSHTTGSLTLNFTLPTAISAGQAWGIRDVTILLSSCDPSCGSCTASTNMDCLTCAAGLYFSGTICVSTCPYYTIPATSQCVLSCPYYYFLNAANSYCEACPSGCSACTATDQCITWDSGVFQQNLFMDLIAVWIIIIILGLIVVGLLIWRFALASKSFYSSMEEEVIDHKPVAEEQKAQAVNQSHEVMDTHWIEDIDDLHMTKVVKKKLPKDSIAGIGQPERFP